jgi:hypothetical protein
MRGEGIKRINDLFEGYKGRFIAPKRTIVDAVVEVVKDLYDITLDAGDVLYTPSTKTVTLRAPGPLKTEVMLRKDEIIVHLKGRLGEKNAPNAII